MCNNSKIQYLIACPCSPTWGPSGTMPLGGVIRCIGPPMFGCPETQKTVRSSFQFFGHFDKVISLFAEVQMKLDLLKERFLFNISPSYHLFIHISFQTLKVLHSSFCDRLLRPKCVKERHCRSFLPAAVVGQHCSHWSSHHISLCNV